MRELYFCVLDSSPPGPQGPACHTGSRHRRGPGPAGHSALTGPWEGCYLSRGLTAPASWGTVHTYGRRPLSSKAPVKPVVPDGPTLHKSTPPVLARSLQQLLPCSPSKWDHQGPIGFQVPWPRTTAPDRGRSPCDDHYWDPRDRLPTLAPVPRARPPGSGHTLTFPTLLGRGCRPQNSRPNLMEERKDMRPKRWESISSSSVHTTRPSGLWGKP